MSDQEYFDEIARIARRAVEDYPNEADRDDRNNFIDSRTESSRHCSTTSEAVRMENEVLDAVERLLDERRTAAQ